MIEPKPVPLVSTRRLERLVGFPWADLKRLAASAGRHYRGFDILDPAGRKKPRHIDNPQATLKAVQARLNARLLAHVPLPDSMLGGRRGRSIRDNAGLHVGRETVATIDVRQCFPSINNKMVYEALVREVSCSARIASVLTKLTTLHRHLPQGAPTSTTLANLVLRPAFAEIEALARRLGLTASIWVDDITLSGRADATRRAVPEVISILSRHGFRVSAAKVKVLDRAHGPQAVTGVVVNSCVSAGRTRVRAVRHEIRSASLAAQRDRPHAVRKALARARHVRWLNVAQGAALLRHAERVGLAADNTRATPSAPTRSTRPCRGLGRCTRRHTRSRDERRP